MLRLWNVNLVVGTFVLTILGTFLTRSGSISSVHAFTTGTIGYFFLAFIALVLVASLGLVAGNSDRLGSVGHLDSAASRETVFLLNNLFLTVFMFTVLVGTLFPLVAEAIRGVKVSVGEPFFNRMSLPVVIVLVFLMGVGPALPWGRASRDELRRKLVPPAAGTALLLAIALAAGMRNAYALAVVALAGYSIVANAREIVIGMQARHEAHGEAWGVALLKLAGGNRRRFGGYLAHIGVFAVAIGIAASSSMRSDREATLKPGESVTIAGRTLRLKSVWGREETQRSVVGATLEFVENGRVAAIIEPRMNFYPASQQPVPTPAVRSSLLGDVYVNLQAFRPDGSNVTVKVIYEPLVPWIWAGGLIVVLGAITSILPQRVRVAREADARQPATGARGALAGLHANVEAT